MILARNLREFLPCKRGVAAVEFGLIAPLLLLALAISIEIGRAYIAYRCFENTVSGVARVLAGFPEYDSTARTQTPLVANLLLPSDAQGKFNLQVSGLKLDQGAMTTTFTHTLVGVNPNLPIVELASSSQFVQGETVIYLAASYDYKPMFDLVSSSAFRMTKTLAINPYFSRSYVWNAGKSPDKYVR